MFRRMWRLAQRGDEATLDVAELPGRSFTGKVARTANSLDPNTRTLLVEADIQNPSGRSLPASTEPCIPHPAPVACGDGPVLGVDLRQHGMQVAAYTGGKRALRRSHRRGRRRSDSNREGAPRRPGTHCQPARGNRQRRQGEARAGEACQGGAEVAFAACDGGAELKAAHLCRLFLIEAPRSDCLDLPPKASVRNDSQIDLVCSCDPIRLDDRHADTGAIGVIAVFVAPSFKI